MENNINNTPDVQENVNAVAQEQNNTAVVEEVKTEPVKEQKQKPVKVNKVKTQEKKKPKKEKQPSKIATSLKETRSELKKVTWPTFGQVVKRTGVVLAVVVVFTLVIAAIDGGLGWLYRLLLSVLK